MTDNHAHRAVIVEAAQSLTLNEFCRAIRVDKQVVIDMVEYELLQPQGHNPQDWRFDSSSLKRGRMATSFHLELEINWPGVNMALNLLDQISSLQGELERMHKMLNLSPMHDASHHE